MSNLSFRDVKKTYPGGVAVIHGVSTEVSDGEFIVIVGPSGCGKSTLLRMVAGLEAITEGEIAIGDRVVNALEPKDRDIAMVFQNYALYPHMNVFENMAYGLKIAKMSPEVIRQKVDAAAEILELSELLQRKPRQLSGGQRQRVAMGRAIVREPAVFLFDEPLSNLDAKLRVQMRLELRQLHERLKTTSLYVTHDQVEAMTLADRMIVLNAGRVEQIGTPMDVYMHPASTFVASFIGSPPMNLLNGTLDGLIFTCVNGTKIQLSKKVAHSGKLILGVRPEHIHIGKTREIKDISALTIRLEMIEELGADSLGYARLGKEMLIFRLPLNAQALAGTELHLCMDEQEMHWFDATSGKRLNNA